MRRVLLIAALAAGCAFDPARPVDDSAVCGDGVRAGEETCDDTNTEAGDGCDDRCRVEAGWSCADGVCTNPPPVAADDEIVLALFATKRIEVLANDADPAGERIQLVDFEPPRLGFASIDDVALTYTGTATGTDVIRYVIQDAVGARAEADLRVHVGLDDLPPIAEAQSVRTSRDTPIDLTLAATDPDGTAPLEFEIATPPSSGSLSTLIGAAVTYTPDTGFAGVDTFAFTAFDGTSRSEPATVTIDVVDWWDAAWTRRRRITIDTFGFDTTTDVPVRIELDSAALESEGALAGGADLRFVALDGALLSHELVSWDPAGAVWVRVPELAAPEVTFWMYYGNPVAPPAGTDAQVWEDDFDAVFHFEDSLEESVSGRTPSPNSEDFRYVPGQHGRGVRVGTENALDFRLAALDVADGGLCAWLFFSGRAGPIWSATRQNGPGSSGELALEVDDASRLTLRMDASGPPSVVSVGQSTQGGWHFVCAEWHTMQDSLRLVVDGVEVGRSDSTGTFAIDTIRLHHDEKSFDGPADEVWLFDGARTDAWMRAQYVLAVGSLVSVGPMDVR